MIKVANKDFFSIKGLVILGAFAFLAIIFLIFFTSGSEAAIITIDDDGPAMFSKIQDGINASNDGDTVYVYNGTYFENVVVNRSINLTGEDRSNTIIDGGGIGDVVSIVSDWVNVTGFNIVNSGMNISDAGVRLDGVQNCNISHNNISHNKEMGIHLNYSHTNTIFDNIFTYNWECGIYLEYADFNILRNNWVETNGNGIGIFYSSYEVIELNNITKHGGYGIYFSYSGNSSVKNNTIIDNAAGGITAGYSTNLTVAWNTVKRELYFCDYGVALWGCDENIIFNNTLNGNGYGVILSYSDKNDILNNNIFGSTNRAIELMNSHENNMINNRGNNNIEAFWLKNCDYNKIIDNTFSVLGGSAIHCENSNWTIIMGNDFSENYYWGMYFSWCSFNNITNNNLSETSGFPPNDGYGIYMKNCQNNNISNNTISLNEGSGIHLLSSSDNTITLNNISHNLLGINMSNSSDNRIYHNSFFNNTNQAYDDSDNGNFWNHSYPVGGNYWSDYSGNDIYKGLNQDQQGPDGIGDTPYIIDINSLDNYPLMQPYQFYNISNYPPSIITQDDETAYADIIYVVDYEAFDYEGDPLTWNLSTNASWLSINSTTGILSGTPNISHLGSYWVNVSVDDGNGGMDYHNFTLTVFETNYPPVITTPNLEWALEDSLYWVDYEYTDGNGDPVTWQLVSNASWLSIDPITGNLTGIPENGDVGSFWVNVSADDGKGGIDYTNFTLTVNNTPPLFTTIPIDQATEDLLHIDDFNSDDDIPGVTVYSLNSNASWLSISSITGILSGTPNNTHVGWFWVNVTVNDGNGGFDSINYTLTVNNTPPLIVTTPLFTTYVSILYIVDFNCTDDGQGDITYDLLTNATWLGIDQLTGIVSGTPTINDVGWYWINVSVDDGNGGIDYVIYVLSVYDIPIYNLDTGEGFWTIQEAIDDPDTMDGHSIFVREGTYYENVVVTKSINLIGENKENTIIDAGGAWDAVRINADHVNISGFTLKNSGDYPHECAGLRVGSNYNNISGNIMISNRHGIFVEDRNNNNIIYDNQISNNDYGIWLNHTDNNHIINNLIISNTWDGIVLNSFSNYNNVSSNSIMSCNTGIYLYDSLNNNIFNNSISLIDWIGLRIFYSYGNYIENNNIFQCNGTAINLYNSQEHNVTHNEIIDNEYGIHIDSSSANNITKNNISWNSEWGIYLVSSSDNHIFYNNILNNTNQAFDDSNKGNQWDNGYPIGGNYWSDYLGQDNFKGPNQDIPGIDGIGDTPYIIDSDSQDNYPLMVTWEDFLILDLEPPVTNHDYDGMWHTSDFTINLTGTDDKSGVNETYYRINNGLIKTISGDGQPLVSIESDNNTLEYWSIDNEGNEEPHRFLYEIKLDKTPPTTTDDYDGYIHYSDFTIMLSGSDVFSGIEDTYYRINDGAVLSVSINGQPTITVESENNSLEYWSVDVAGNIEEHHSLYGIKLNKTYPDLTVTSEDIVFSKSRLIEGMEVYINTTIHNIGNLSAHATVKVYDGEPGLGLLIGEAIVNVEGQGSDIASIVWSTSPGVHNIHVLISDSIPYEPFTHNNGANKNITVEIPPILVLSVGDMNIFRFESGEERTVPVYVTCYNNSATNIRLLVLDNRGLNITVVTPPQNLSKDEMTIFYLRIKVPVLGEGEEFKEEDILLQVKSDEVLSNSESLDIIVGKSAADFLGLFLLLGGAAAGAGTVAFIGGTEIGKYAVFAASMSLYTRLKREDVLDQETRGMIRGYIIANPGEHYNAIKRALDLKNGTLAYHLKTLEKEKLIKSVRDGRYKRFYPPNMKVSENVVILNKAQELIMGKIIDNPGISQKELANIVGLSTSTINYHISVMANAGFIRVERKGKHTMCFPEDEAA